MRHAPAEITVLHVDDEPDFAAMAAEFVERESDHIVVETATSAEEGLERLAGGDFDCVVSDYDMPGTDGIEFLEAVRRDDPDLPFVLFTGKGSEEVASEAISAGVTDYLQKRTGTDRYALLANRIANAVAMRRAEREVQDTQLRYQRLIKEASDVILVVDANGDFSYVSPASRRVLGYPAEDLVGENGFEYVHPDDRGDTMESFQAMVEDPELRATAEFRFDHGDGEWRWVEVRGRNLVEDPVVGGIVVYARDVTERREQAARFEALVENSTDLVTVLDTDGTIAYESPVVERMLGYDPADLVGENAFDYVHPDDREAAFETFAEAIEAEEPVTDRATYRFRHADGSWVWLETVGSNTRRSPLDGVVLNTRDVTERKRRERELQRYEAMVNQSGDLVYAADAGGYLTAVNDAAARFVGYEPEELEGEHVSTVLTDASVERGRQVIRDLLEEGDRASRTYELEVVTVDGQVVECENNVTVLVNDAGELSGTVGVVRDRSG